MGSFNNFLVYSYSCITIENLDTDESIQWSYYLYFFFSAGKIWKSILSIIGGEKKREKFAFCSLCMAVICL